MALKSKYEYLGFLTKRANQLLMNRVNEEFKKSGFDITLDQWVVLKELSQNEKLNQVELGEKCFKNRVSITKIVDNLEKRELVQRCPCDKDRRIKYLLLTDLGKTQEKALTKIKEKFVDEYESLVSKEDLEVAKRVLNTIIKEYDD